MTSVEDCVVTLNFKEKMPMTAPFSPWRRTSLSTAAISSSSVLSLFWKPLSCIPNLAAFLKHQFRHVVMWMSTSISTLTQCCLLALPCAQASWTKCRRTKHPKDKNITPLESIWCALEVAFQLPCLYFSECGWASRNRTSQAPSFFTQMLRDEVGRAQDLHHALNLNCNLPSKCTPSY